MSSILIKESLIGGATQDLLIVGNRIDKIGADLLPVDEDTIILEAVTKRSCQDSATDTHTVP